MKILQINNVYGERSTGILTQVLHHGLLAAGEASLVVYGRGRGAKERDVIRLCPDWYGKMNSLLSRFTGVPYGGCHFSTVRLMGIIAREKPDVVHLQCINGNFMNVYRLVAWLKKRRIKTVVSLHAEFLYTGNCAHTFDCDQWRHGCKRCPDGRHSARSWQAMRAAFAGFEKDCVLCPVSPWVEARAQCGDILKAIPMRTVCNSVDGAFGFGPQAKAEENTVLHVTAHFSSERDHPKGGWYVLELARRMPEMTFYVAGRTDKNVDTPSNVHLLGDIRDRERLADHYRRAKLTVLTSRRETFSMPCAESLCCGTPVVGFRAGGPEGIALADYSEFVEFGDVDALEQAVRRWLGAEPDREAMAKDAREAYSSDAMTESFLEIYRGLLWK